MGAPLLMNWITSPIGIISTCYGDIRLTVHATCAEASPAPAQHMLAQARAGMPHSARIHAKDRVSRN